ncbi:MAG: porin family protein [Candidatus Eisenbacteria bacterium]
MLHSESRDRWMRSFFASFFAAAMVVLLPPSLAQASEPGAAGNIGPHLAFSKAKDANDGNFLVGGHLELLLAPILGIQGSADYRSEDHFVARTPLGNESLHVRTIPLLLTGRLYLPGPMPIRPFALAGAGWYHVAYDYSAGLESRYGFKDESVDTFGWHVGAGVNLPLGPDVTMSAEGRYNFVDPERKLGHDVRDAIRDLDYDAYTLGVGLNFGF